VASARLTRRAAAAALVVGMGIYGSALVALASTAAAQQEGAAAPPEGSAAEERQGREADLRRIREEMARLETSLAGLKRRESGAEDQLARMEVELSLQAERIAEARAARDLAAARVDELSGEVTRLGDELAAVRTALRRRLAGLYRLGRQGYLRMLLSIEPGGDVLGAVRMLRVLVRRDAEAVDRYVALCDRLEGETAALAAEQRERASWVEREETRRRELARLRSRQRAVVARLGGERRQLAERAAELADREQKLANFLDFLYGSQERTLGGAPIQEFRGVLDWPAEGAVSVGFGPRRDPRYRTTVPHNGVEIATRPGAPVRAVYPGKVLFASPFRGYGPTVVVLHPGRVFTLYAGLSRLRVGKDDMVSLNDVVGAAADALYFEIRVDNVPEDPRHWLR
jgi:septal ring factor EnvC (AmiA/AmiB activator)